MSTWRLKPGADRSIRAHHPWVFSNDLAHSPKGLVPGTFVKLMDTKGMLVAVGYGNPNSQIVFRALNFDLQKEVQMDLEFFVTRAVSAWQYRHEVGHRLSMRLVYGESDFLPGLVIDRYVVEKSDGKLAQVFAVQVLTAGMNLNLAPTEQMLLRFIERVVEDAKKHGFSEFAMSDTAVVLRNDVNVRKLEGLEVEEEKTLRCPENLDLAQALIWIRPVAGDAPVKMRCNLANGQKTGFFLDQAHNIALVCGQLQKTPQPLKVLDLCCYVGQWSTQIARLGKTLGQPVHTTLVDVSAEALKFAEENARREGAEVTVLKQDVLDGLKDLPEGHFDIVIADPPAFIKAKKDIPTGSHAYLKLNANAFKLTKPGGLVVSCSCSGLFTQELMIEVLAKASRRQGVPARCVLHGGHSSDHPNLMTFPEGFYLKMFLHKVRNII